MLVWVWWSDYRSLSILRVDFHPFSIQHSVKVPRGNMVNEMQPSAYFSSHHHLPADLRVTCIYPLVSAQVGLSSLQFLVSMCECQSRQKQNDYLTSAFLDMWDKIITFTVFIAFVYEVSKHWWSKRCISPCWAALLLDQQSVQGHSIWVCTY